MGSIEGIGVFVMLGILVGSAALILFRRRIWVPPAMGLIVLSMSLAWFLSPECVLIPDADVAVFEPLIENRTETGMVGQPIFPQINGSWFQCKVGAARLFFF